MKNKKLIISALLYGLIIVFLAQYIRTIDFREITGLSVNYWYLLVASLTSLAFRYWGVFIWKIILERLGAVHLPSFKTLSAVYAKAWLGRYIPGTVTWIAGKVFFASSHGISKKRLVTASILEGAVQVIAIFAISLIFLGLDSRLDVVSTQLRIILVAIGIVTSLVLVPRVFNRIIVLLARLFRKKDFNANELKSNKKAVSSAFLLYSIGYFISGASYFFLAKSIYPIGFDNFFFTVAAFNIAGAIGIASIVTPSGLGVREGIQLLLLPLIMPREAALIVTVVARLWSVIIDLLFFGLAQLFHKKSKSTYTEHV